MPHKTAEEVYELLMRLFCLEIKQEEYANTKRIKVKHWSIILLPEEKIKDYPAVEQNSIQNIEAFDGAGTQKIFFFEAMHRGAGISIKCLLVPCMHQREEVGCV
jgi:hypothetical protein